MFSWLFSDPLPVGAKAPDFTLTDDGGHIVKLSKLRGRSVVLVFYPADDTPGCTKQLCQFRDDWSEALSRGAEVFGVNPGSQQNHVKFREKFHLPFPLLMDPGQRVATLYHCNGVFVKRTVYLVGPDGTIKFAQRGMPAPAAVLAGV